MIQTRREERREETLQEIKDLAWRQIANEGAGNISLRAISREMRMSSAALFRYFRSREALLTALSADAFRSINAAMAAASDATPPGQTARRIQSACLAYRAWALANPEKYALIYGSAIAGYKHDWSSLLDEARRGLEIILEIIDQARLSGAIRLPEISPRLREQLSAVIAKRLQHYPPEVFYAALTGWIRLHGLVSLEVFGHLSPLLPDPGELYRQEIAGLLGMIGLEEPDTKGSQQ